MSGKPFKLGINLDDEVEVEGFLSMHEPIRGVVLAHRLGFRGRHCKRAANALMNYAQNKRTAMCQRRVGHVSTTLHFETICDRIYRKDIQPLIECG